MANNNSLNNTSYGFTLPSLNLNFTSTAQRITGDMSNATHANRLSFQTNVVNGATSPFIIPNGSGTIGQIVVANASDPTNSAFGSLQVDATSVKLVSNVLGTGVQLPMEIRIGTTAAINIDNNLAVSILNTVAGNIALTVNATATGGVEVQQNTAANAGMRIYTSLGNINGPRFEMLKSRSGGNVNAGDSIGNFIAYGYQTGYQSAAQILFKAESVAASRVSGSIGFLTTSTAGASSTRLNISADGAVTIPATVTGNVPLTITGTDSGGLVVNQATSGAASIYCVQSSADIQPVYINSYKNRAGGNINAGDALGQSRFYGFVTSFPYQLAAQSRCYAESIGAARVSGAFDWYTTSTAGVSGQRLNISADGAVTIPATVAGNVPLTITATNIGGLGVNQANSGAVSISLTQSSADVQPNYINIFKNRAGGNINAGDVISQMQFLGFATASQLAASSRCYAESIGAARVSGAFDWFTTSTAGVSGQRLYLGSDGALVINTPVAAQTALTVNGFNTAGTYAQQFLAVTPGAQFSAFRALNNTATAGSSCLIECSVTGQVAATGGDPFLRFNNYGTNGISLGLDTSANQFSMSKTLLGDGNTFLTFDNATNQINLPLQCSFMAEVSVAIPNVTGNGAAYNVIFNSERFDVSNSYNNATGIFTAPKTGKYLFSGSLRISGLTALMTYAQVVLVNSGGNLLFGINNIGLIRSVTTAADNCCIPFSAVVSMTAGDATFIQVIIFNGAGNTAGIAISTSFWSGQLLS